MVYVNRVGCEDGLTFGGGSMVIDPFGRVVAELAEVSVIGGRRTRRRRVVGPRRADPWDARGRGGHSGRRAWTPAADFELDETYTFVPIEPTSGSTAMHRIEGAG